MEHFTPEEIARATRYHRPLYVATLAATGIDIVALAVLTQLDLPLAWPLEVVLLPALVAAALWTLLLPVSWWRYRHERTWGFSVQSPRGWGADRLRGLGVALVFTVVPVGGLLALAQLWPQAWPWAAAVAGAALALTVSFVAPVLLEPVFNRFRPLDGELARDLRALADRAGVPVRDVLVADASRRTRKLNAYVSGIGRTRRVVVWDTLLDAPRDEVEVIVAHELGHRRMRHVLQGTLLAVAGVVVFVVVLRLLVPRPAPSDAALVLLLGSALELLVLPFGTAVSRRWERTADRFSLAVTHDRAAFRRLHRRLALANLADLDPPRAAYVWLHSHPTPSERIELAS